MAKSTDAAKAAKVEAKPLTYKVGPKAVTTKRGILAPGASIEAKDVMNEGTFEKLVDLKLIVKDES